MTCRAVFAFLACLALCNQAFAADEIDQLMSELSRHKGGRARFVEKKYIGLLDKPVVSSGELIYTAPDRLEKRTFSPKPEILLLDKGTMRIEREHQKRTIRLANQPEALAFIDSIRGTLIGDRVMLERNYTLSFVGTAEKWVLSLQPKDQKIAALVQRITVSGIRGQVHSIEFLQADGDRSEMSVEPIELK